MSPGGKVALGNGPIRKRDDERVRRNKDDFETDTITAIGSVEVPNLDMHSIGCAITHPLVKEIYESLKTSAQARFFEPSDWSYARLTMYVLNDLLNDGNIGAMKLQAINQMLSNLLMTEGDRRRVRLEIDRKAGPDGGAKVFSMADHYKQELGVTPT